MASEREKEVRIEEEEFEYVLEILRQQLLDASCHFYIWEQLWPTENVVDVIRRYKGFFQPTRAAHLESLIIKVSDIVSNKANAPSLYRILNMVVVNSRLAPDIDVLEVKQRIQKQKKTLEAIKNFRNTRVAHWDTSVEKLEKPVLFGDTKRMLKELTDIFNKISLAHSKEEWSFRYTEKVDVITLVNGLKRLMIEDSRRIEQLIREMREDDEIE